MTDSSNSSNSATRNSEFADSQSSPPKIDLIAKGVATGVVVSTITQTCKSIVSVVVKNPLAIFAAGFTAGYFTHKYRKGILSAGHKAAEQGKDFVSRQKKNFVEILGEAEES